jgi:geranylgeranyl reductase family protein
MDSDTLSPEILVIGAGPGGSAAAWTLAQQGHDVLLIDRARFPRDKTCGDGLTPAAVQTLDQLGLLPQLEAAGAYKIEGVRVISAHGLSTRMAFVDCLKLPKAFGLSLPRFQFDDIVRNHAIQAGSRFLGGVHVVRLDRQGDRIVSIQCEENGRPIQINARHVVIAVGANTALLRREGLIAHQPRYMRAMRAYYDHVENPGNDFQLFFDAQLRHGYGWIFPIRASGANIGIATLDSGHAHNEYAPTSSHQLHLDFISRHTGAGTLNADMQQVSPVKGYPIRVDFPSHRIAGENWVMIGEAAGLVNPFTGEGIDLALQSGVIAGEIMGTYLNRGASYSSTYHREIHGRYGSTFRGLRPLFDIATVPFLSDHLVRVGQHHEFFSQIFARIIQGLAPPSNVFHPLFLLELLVPFSPGRLVKHFRDLRPNGRETTPAK